MIELLKTIYSLIRQYGFYMKSDLGGIFSRKKFKSVKTFCLFIGYPRSGHSLVASLLDAHPNIAIGMEWDVLYYLEKGYKKYQIFWSLLKSSKMFSAKNNNIWTGYNYKVESPWQGNYDNIKIIGDKKANTTSIRIIQNPEIINTLHKVINKKIKFIHVIRNPYDIITTMAIRFRYKILPGTEPEYIDLLPNIRRFFINAELIRKLKIDNQVDIINVYHEELVSDPKKTLEKIIRFLEIDAEEEYLNSCSKIVYIEPHKSRLRLSWPDELKKFVQGEIKKYDFLSHYTFEK